MTHNTIEETFEYRIRQIVKKTLEGFGAELADFSTEDELMDYLYNKDIAEGLGRELIGDMQVWTDDWLEQLQGEAE